jgi:hypothetical protein
VLIVRVLEKLGNPEAGLNEQEALEGRPVQERPTDCDEPLVKPAVIVLDPAKPGPTLMPPEAEREKSKACTDNVNCVVWVCPPPVPVTVIGNKPVGVEDDVLMVRTLEKGGTPDG